MFAIYPAGPQVNAVKKNYLVVDLQELKAYINSKRNKNSQRRLNWVHYKILMSKNITMRVKIAKMI